MVKNILIINIGIYLLDSFLGLRLIEFFGLRVIFSEEWRPHQFLSYMWLHSTSSFWHLAGNMFAVFIFGPMLETVWGSKRFLIFYLVCGIGAGVLYGTADYFEKRPLHADRISYFENPNPESFKIFIVDHQPTRRILFELENFSDEFFRNPNSEALKNESKIYVDQIYQCFLLCLEVLSGNIVIPRIQ